MATYTTTPRPAVSPETATGIRLWLIKSTLLLPMIAAMLFISAGQTWPMGWVHVGAYVVWLIIYNAVLIPRRPELVAERSRLQAGSKKWDIVIGGFVASYLPMATWIVAGLDVGNGWSPPLPLWAQLAALAVMLVLYNGLLIWAMLANPFFSVTVRIQSDRGHTVASDGPYRYVRHPGYVAAMLFHLATPIQLGALWAYIPVGLMVVMYVIRTALEDKTLQAELPGYVEYAHKTRYRLLPGIW